MSATVAQRPSGPLPRASFIAVLAILGVTLVCTAAARLTHFAAVPPTPAALATVDLNFFDLPDGGVAVRNAETGVLISTVPARAGGFLRSTMRVLATERAAYHIGPAQPFSLTAFPGNRLVLTDTATGQKLELEAFGPSNESEFFTLLAKAEAKP
jgi:putative photosynthetic complex assembly protein